MVLAALTNASRWEGLDQVQILPGAAQPLLRNSHFPKHGACSRVKRMVHGLALRGFQAPVDTWGLSCTNGWTGGNWAGATEDAARVVQSLWGSHGLLQPATAAAMRKMRPLDKGVWGIGLPYGLGTMDLGSSLGGIYTRPVGTYIGHGGETYGFTGQVGYIPKLNASLAVFANAEDVLATASAAAGALSLMGV